jgi:MFS family permease
MADARFQDAAQTGAAEPTADVRPQRSLWLLAIAHAVNHGQAVLLPLIFLAIIEEFHVSPATIAFLAAAGAIGAGLIQVTFGYLTRVVSRRSLLGVGGVLFGAGSVLQAAAGTFPMFAFTNIASRLGSAPQHPVGNGLLAEQFPPERRGFAISAHISGGNVGTVIFGVTGTWILAAFGWRGASLLIGVPAIVVAVILVLVVREHGTDRLAAVAQGSLSDAYRLMLRSRDLLWVFAASVLGGGGRGLGVVNLFVLLYLTDVIHVSTGTRDLMYAVLIVMSVPAPLLAGMLSDRFGRRPLIVGVYLAGAIGFAVFVLAGSSLVGLWAGILIMGAFSFAESPQLQALLADISPAGTRDVSFATYFTLAFGVGSLWTALYGQVIGVAGEASGLPIVFWLMAGAFVLAALAILPISAAAEVRGDRTTPPDAVA